VQICSPVDSEKVERQIKLRADIRKLMSIDRSVFTQTFKVPKLEELLAKIQSSGSKSWSHRTFEKRVLLQANKFHKEFLQDLKKQGLTDIESLQSLKLRDTTYKLEEEEGKVVGLRCIQKWCRFKFNL
jgi:hypothetical protein